MSVNTTGKSVETYSAVTSRVVLFPQENVDTDQIIPARFLKVTDTVGVGAHLFEDLRRNAEGALRPDFPLNRKENEGSAILLAGGNFGCGSSREHAAWALVGAGIRAVVSTSFADIFRNNALKNGLLPIAVNATTWSSLAKVAASGGTVTIDLRSQEVSWSDGKVRFEIDPFSRTCLLNGTDELGYILAHEADIAAFEGSSRREAVR
jgi:3-isopropylmalate/(R)-2-methylmalate dehydratase small subunit